MKQFVSKVDTQEDRNTHISSQETARVEASREEDIESIDQSEDGKGNHGDPSSNRLDDGVIWNVLFGKLLKYIGLSKTDVNDATADP